MAGRADLVVLVVAPGPWIVGLAATSGTIRVRRVVLSVNQRLDVRDHDRAVASRSCSDVAEDGTIGGSDANVDWTS